MRALLEATDLYRFRAAIAERFGLHFDDTKLGSLAGVLERRVGANGDSTQPYLDRLESSALPRGEIRELARELTVAETYFFRHIDQFRAFAEVALPDRLSARSSSRQLRLLSAGCASGEEPYSLAILLLERAREPGWNVSVRGVDVNTAMLEKAAAGRYSAWSLRESPAEIQRRWFVSEGRDFTLVPAVRSAVTFDERNLAHDDSELWQPETYDVIFCRNVIMYFTPESAHLLVTHMTKALVPGGYLFLGHAETLRGLSQDFHLRHTHGTFYYQRKASTESVSVAPVPIETRQFAMTPSVADPDWTATWIETIQRSSERIRELSERTDLPFSKESPSGAAERAGADLSVAFRLLEEERFIEALEVLGNLSPDSARDPDVLILRAALLTHGGQVTAAQSACAQLLALDDLNAGAHYLLALCRESEGDRQGAIHHDQIALYLDPRFAMPRLHLGLLAQRAGDPDGAHRELEQAIALLQSEDPPRLLLFGGGFSREALISLCRSHLLAARGRA